ncbi:MAG: hypothetical protein ACI90V_010177 [Bacillariaceae sp.]|jgi:hypothetical protein
MVCTYFLNFIISIVAAVYYDHGEKETASAYHLFGCTLFNGMVFFISFLYMDFILIPILKRLQLNLKKRNQQMDG